ncbi:uncharacterized protein LOC111411557 [Olea europaea var. sylvestris]|uniref:uncharacterized protein LOC111411557 n=1 Tax=Olea europaea var. sylvestris TaxID=158386 RepID=UPI000C1D534C|nr:uncharacterized protein LOC111411557 [Olea europaea var. sylvestris]
MTKLNISSYREAGVFIDQHRDMRLDVDRMTCEARQLCLYLLWPITSKIAPCYQNLAPCFKDVDQCENLLDLYTDFRLYIVLSSGISALSLDVDFRDQENIENLNSGHEYNVDCIKKWLLIKKLVPYANPKH